MLISNYDLDKYMIGSFTAIEVLSKLKLFAHLIPKNLIDKSLPIENLSEKFNTVGIF